ncbi:MAG: histidinol-phosphate transaminase [Methanomicrobiales archaeon]|nr:histidinol-phosphate transaminase [Methanomicrobiales archaeon]
MRPSVRDIYRETCYVYATRAEEIARKEGHKRLARLASNENPFPLSTNARAEAVRALDEVHRYPPEYHTRLTELLVEKFSWNPVVVGNGMDGIIETVIRTLIEPGDKVVISEPTFSFYRVAAAAQGGDVISVRREKDFSVDVPEFIHSCRQAKLAFLCTPNNPTGNLTSREDVKKILDSTDSLLFLDNAYIEFADTDYCDLMKEYDHLVIGRTMSKVYSMAGMRLGYAFVPTWLEPCYHRASTPFAVNRVTAAAAVGALTDLDHVRRIREHAIRWRARFKDEVKFRTFPSQANFILIDTAPHKGNAMMEQLARKGVLVRSCDSFPGLGDHYIRVNIGEDWENELFLQEINAV